ncbi:MAG TPA: hypothetical protein VG406_11925 [Isosphaeraceae bacterium]|jgi:hypothetical protein|nr:hypothetical protein [Isosphaeraceae bacterium]
MNVMTRPSRPKAADRPSTRREPEAPDQGRPEPEAPEARVSATEEGRVGHVEHEFTHGRSQS